MSEKDLENNKIDVSPDAEGEETEGLPEESEAGQTSSSNKTRNAVIAIVVPALLLIGAYFYIERSRNTPEKTEAAEDKEAVVVSVKVAKAEKDSIAKENTALGTVAPAEQSTVSASISAQIKQMRLLKNAFVQKGEVLAVLASQDLQGQRNEAQAAVQEAKLNLETLQKVTIPQTTAQTEKDLSDAKAGADNARATYERRKDLYARGGISLKELETSQLALTNAENNLRLVRQNAGLNKSAVNPNARAIAESKIRQAEARLKTIDAQAALAEVRAPLTGIVTDQFQFEGDFAAQGAKLLTIADIGSVIIKANFADSVVVNLKTGDGVTIYPTGLPDERMGGTVTLISRSTDPQNRTVEVWANFANGSGRLRAGDAVQFVVASQSVNDAIVVPAAAVQLEAANSDEGVVMTVDGESVAHETKVKVGIKSGGKIQILEGLEGGETVVIEGNYSLPDGTKVEIAIEDESADETEKE
jgi:RND family efflux transporter MFP subunit